MDKTNMKEIEKLTNELIDFFADYPLKKRYRKKLENMAYKTMGLEKKLRESGLCHEAEQLLKAHIIAMWTVERWLSNPGLYGNPPSNMDKIRAYKIMDSLSRKFNYNSGKIKYRFNE